MSGFYSVTTVSGWSFNGMLTSDSAAFSKRLFLDFFALRGFGAWSLYQSTMGLMDLRHDFKLSWCRVSVLSSTIADCIAWGLSVPLWRLVKDAEDLRREQSAAKKR